MWLLGIPSLSLPDRIQTGLDYIDWAGPVCFRLSTNCLYIQTVDPIGLLTDCTSWDPSNKESTIHQWPFWLKSKFWTSPWFNSVLIYFLSLGTPVIQQYLHGTTNRNTFCTVPPGMAFRQPPYVRNLPLLLGLAKTKPPTHSFPNIPLQRHEIPMVSY